MAANTRVFDPSVATKQGDAMRLDVKANAPVLAPVTVKPGQSRTVKVTFAPKGAKGSVVSGDLFVDDYQGGGAANELADIPYRYKVGK
jgi:hypothetical protein